MTDITEIRAARETILRQATQLADAARMAKMCFWRLPADGDRYEWDAASYEQFRADPASFTPTRENAWALVDPADRPRLIEALNAVMATGETASIVFRVRRLDGTPMVRWSLLSAERDEQGRIIGIRGASQDITEREALLAALTKRDLQIAEAGRLAGLGFWRRPFDGSDRLEWSAEMYRHIGETPETFTPTLATLYERILPEDREPTRAVAARVLATGEPSQIVYRIRRADGTICHRWVSIAVERGANGEVSALAGVGLDITKEIEAKQRIARQERQIAEVGQVAGIGFYSRSLDGKRFECTPVFRRQHGFADDEPITFAQARKRVHPEDLPALRALTQRLLRGEESACGLFRAVLPGGAIRRIRVHSSVERDGSGQPVAISGITQDVTEEVEARERLERQQAVLEAARRAGRIGFFRRCFETDVYEWSPEIYEEYGVDPATFVPTRAAIAAMIHPDDRAEAEAALERRREGSDSLKTRFRIIRPDGSIRWRESVGKLERDESGRPVAVVGVTRDLTEELEARAQLAEQAERLRQLERVAKVGFYRRSLDGTQMYASEEKPRQFGLPIDSGPHDVSVFRALFHLEDLWRIEEGARRILETGATETATARVCRPDGEIRWLRIIAGLERDAEGRPVAVTGISQDATEEVEANERLRRQERLLADASRVARLGFWRRRVGEESMEWSDGMYGLFGVEPGSVQPTLELIRQRIHPDDLQRADEMRLRLEATGESGSIEYRVLLDDGSVRWLRVTAGVERDRDGAAIVFGITQDVTESVDAAERLARQRRQLAEAGRVAGLGFWRLPIGSDRFELSEAIYEQMGLDPTRFVPTAEAMRALILEEDRETVFSSIEKVRLTGERLTFSYRLRRPDGAIRHRSTTAALERAADGTPIAIVGVSQDITDRVEQERRLQHAQRLNALGELTGGIAHDVNNLLSIIGLNLELLRELAPSGESQELTEAALQAVAQGAKLTRGLLAFAQRQSLRPAPIPLAPLLHGLESLLRRALGGRVLIRAEVAEGTPPILADSAQFESALVNLVLNARDAMPDGGTVTISAAPAAAEEVDAIGLAGEHVRITVADEGVGMTAEVLARAFEPFFTTKGAGKGTGLGLAMVYGFARQSGGEVRIESSPGAGTTVTLWLPAAAADGEATSRPIGDHAALKGAVVLVVEDETPLRALIERLCTEAGMHVHAVADGEAAMALLRYGVRIDVLVSDIRMPGRFDGHSLAIEARALRDTLPILLMTGYDDTGMDDLAWPLLRKPFSRAELLDALATVLRRSPALQAAK